jgi:OOP family OmpA-OmpF porin
MTRNRLRVGVLAALLALGVASAAIAQAGANPNRGNTGPAIPPPPPPPPPPSDYVVYFSFDQPAITPEAQAILQKAAQDVASGAAEGADYRAQLVKYNTRMADPGQNPNHLSASDEGVITMFTAKEAVVGYTDTSGSVGYNLRLSERRAKAAADALVGLGVPQKSIDVSWKGKSDPAVQTGDGVKEPLNRRVTIHVGFGS